MRHPSLQYFEENCPCWSEKPDHPALPEGFAGARGGGCGKGCRELCFEAWLLDLVTLLRSAATQRFRRFATGLTPLDLMASSNATVNRAG